MSDLKFPKPVKGEHRKKRKAEHDSKMETFRIDVMALDLEYGCCNHSVPFRVHPPVQTFGMSRSHFEAAHLSGRGRSPETKYDAKYGIRLCWWCHDALDGRHNFLWPELTPDERKILVLQWWRKYKPEHFDSRGWALPLEALENSVARRKV